MTMSAPPNDTLPGTDGVSPRLPRGPVSLEAFDAGRRRRWMVALGISLAVNAVIFGSAGVVAHYFLLSLRPKPKPIVITRIIVPAKKHPVAASPAPTASPLPSH